MSLADLNKWLEQVRRGRLSHQEEEQLQSLLARQPELRPELEEELQLNDLLQRLPDAPVSTNFTARVIAAVQADRQPLAQPRHRWSPLSLRGWIPRFAVAGVLFGCGILVYQQHESRAQLELVRSVAEFQELIPPGGVELLKNFEAIQKLEQVPADADRALIAALQ